MKKPKTSSGNKVNKAWLHDHINDPYVKRAQHDGYRSRAAYKLGEIDATFGLIRPGQWVVDLGSAPGAWSQYLRRKLLPSAGAAIMALDVLPMEPIDGVHFIQGDFRDDAVLAQLTAALHGRRVDVVVSDMAPNLSGIAAADAAASAHLLELALAFAQQHLQPQGALVAKAFHGAGYDDTVQQFKATFVRVKPFKPQASRGRSAETFLVGIGLKNQSLP